MRSAITFFTTSLVALTLASSVQAAPQILGVVATASPLKLQCDAETCKTSLSTICMQAQRDTPERDHPYQAHDLSIFSVVAKTENGDVVRLSLDEAAFTAARGYTGTTMSFPTDVMTSRGLTPMAVAVSKGGLLIPTEVAGDPDPIVAGEVEQVRASLQPAADKIFEEHGSQLAAIQVVNRLMNETPEHGRMAKSDRENLWDNTFGESARESTGVGMRRAADMLGYCQYRTKQGRFFSVRRCLEQRLDGMLMEINTDYWRATQPGS